jgi:hypothetical protein
MHKFKNKKRKGQTSVSNLVFIGRVKSSSFDKFELIPDSLDDRGIFS